MKIIEKVWLVNNSRVLSLYVSGRRWNQGQTYKNRTRPITSHLTEEAWLVKDLYMTFGEFFCGT